MNDDARRRSIQDAMTRLIEGKPIRSDGKLTVKSLAEEAGVKRWILTHKFPELGEEFKARIQDVGKEPAIVHELRNQLKEHEHTNKQLRAEIRELKEDRNQLERVINVLSLEVQHGKVENTNVLDIKKSKRQK